LAGVNGLTSRSQIGGLLSMGSDLRHKGSSPKGLRQIFVSVPNPGSTLPPRSCPAPPTRRSLFLVPAAVGVSFSTGSAKSDSSMGHLPLRRQRRFNAIPGESMAVLIENLDVGGAYTLLESTILSGTATPLHYHGEADEAFVVLSGALDVVIGGVWTRATPGSTVRVPRSAYHGFADRSVAAV